MSASAGGRPITPEPVAPALTRRLLFVTGKGGVGKSTVAAALGLLAARHGRRTIVAEVARRDDVSRALGAGGEEGRRLVETQLAPGLFWTTVDPEAAMEEYLLDQLPVRALAQALASSRAFSYLAAATPGLRELLTVGKLWELAQPQRRTEGAEPYDLVVVDAPATGHGLAYLSAPRTFADAARVGPIARQGQTIHEMLADPSRTGVVAVTAPGELPVSETLTLAVELRERMGLELDRVVVNGLQPERFSARDAAELRRLRDELRAADDAGPGAPPALVAVEAALSQHSRAREQRRQLRRLQTGTGRAPATLPFLFVPALGREELGRLAARLERAL